MLQSSTVGFPGGTSGKDPTYQRSLDERDAGRSFEVGLGNPLQYFCLENTIGRRAWQATVHRVTKRWTRVKQVSTQRKLLPCRQILDSLSFQGIPPAPIFFLPATNYASFLDLPTSLSAPIHPGPRLILVF